MKKDTVLITGATGFIGKHIVKELLSQDSKKLILASKTRKPDLTLLKGSKSSIEYESINLDLSNKENLNLLDKYDVSLVIHSAGELGGSNIPYESLWRANFQSTRNLIDYYNRSRNIDQIIFLSSFGVLGPIEPSKIPADETQPYNPSNPYEKTKTLAEKYVLLSNLPYTIIRPEFVYGPEDLHVLPLFKSIVSGKFMLISHGGSYLHPTYIDDLTQSINLIAKNKRAIGETFNIAGERYLTVKEFAQKVYIEIHQKEPVFHDLPKYLLSPPTLLADVAAKITKTNLPISSSRVKFFTENRAVDYSKAVKKLGYKPVPVEEGIHRTIRWYIENRHL